SRPPTVSAPPPNHARTGGSDLAARDRLLLQRSHAGVEVPAVEIWTALDRTELEPRLERREHVAEAVEVCAHVRDDHFRLARVVGVARSLGEPPACGGRVEGGDVELVDHEWRCGWQQPS